MDDQIEALIAQYGDSLSLEERCAHLGLPSPLLPSGRWDPTGLASNTYIYVAYGAEAYREAVLQREMTRYFQRYLQWLLAATDGAMPSVSFPDHTEMEGLKKDIADHRCSLGYHPSPSEAQLARARRGHFVYRPYRLFSARFSEEDDA